MGNNAVQDNRLPPFRVWSNAGMLDRGDDDNAVAALLRVTAVTSYDTVNLHSLMLRVFNNHQNRRAYGLGSATNG